MMYLKTCRVVVNLVVFGATVGIVLAFPSSIERCKAGDTTCLAATMNKVILDHYQGIPELDLAPLDPLRFKNIFLSQGGDSPVTMDLSMAEGDIIGWRQMKVTQVVGFEKDPKTSKFEMVVTVPVDIILGKYEINGKLLLVPLKGQGNLNITHTDMKMEVKFKTKVITRDNEDYLQIRKVHLELYCKTAHYLLGNLFNSQEISDGLNAALNADSKLVFDATRKSFAEARGGIIQRYLQPFFDKTPYRMLFAE